jgi:hypothetical protein
MTNLEDLVPNVAVRGVLLDALVSVISVKGFGSSALELAYKGPSRAGICLSTVTTSLVSI